MSAPVPVRSVARRGLADEAADLIREAILNGRYNPGDPLREVDLAAMLDVSRGSVREGLTILETEGLISRGWHRGTRVIDVTTEDVIEVYAVRAALDRLAAMTARDKASLHDLADLEAIVDAMAEALSREASGAELVGLDIAFHDLIYRSAGNQRLSAAWRAIRSQIHFFQLRRTERSDHDYRARLVLEHRNFVGLLRSGTKNEVGREAEQHVYTARETLLNDLGRHD